MYRMRKRICITDELYLDGRWFKINETFDISDVVINEDESFDCIIFADDRSFQIPSSAFVLIPDSERVVCKDVNQRLADTDFNHKILDYQKEYENLLGIKPPNIIDTAVERRDDKRGIDYGIGSLKIEKDFIIE